MKQTPTGTVFDERLRVMLESVHAEVRRQGAVLLSSHVADHFGSHYLKGFVPRDNAWARACDLYIGLLPFAPTGHPYRSEGLFVEVGLAIAHGKRVVLVLENPASELHSHFVRNLDEEPGVRIIEMESFLSNVAHFIKDELATAKQLNPGSEPRVTSRRQTTDPDHALEILEARQEPEIVVVNGVSLLVMPGVFSPSVSHSPDYLIATWSIPAGSRVLDLGSGCGILGVFALLQGAGHLVAVDANPTAVDNTAMNLARLNLTERATVIQSTGYDALPPSERFDVIILSPPFWDREAPSLLSRSCYDPGHQFLRDSIAGAASRLAQAGAAYLVFSDQGDVSLLFQIIHKAGLVVDKLHLFRPTMVGGHIRLVLRLTRMD